jgi:hypothetical protein
MTNSPLTSLPATQRSSVRTYSDWIQTPGASLDGSSTDARAVPSSETSMLSEQAIKGLLVDVG